MTSKDPLPYELEGQRYASNDYPLTGWGEYFYNPRNGYDDHECVDWRCDLAKEEH